MTTRYPFRYYKGYIIELTQDIDGDFSRYAITKQIPDTSIPDGFKNIYLKKMGFEYIEYNSLLQKAKDYIDSYSHILEERFKNYNFETDQ